MRCRTVFNVISDIENVKLDSKGIDYLIKLSTELNNYSWSQSVEPLRKSQILIDNAIKNIIRGYPAEAKQQLLQIRSLFENIDWRLR